MSWLERSAWPGVLVVCACVLGARPAVAQESAPRLPFGSAAVVLPLQATQPSPGGAWPGLTSSEKDARRMMDAELMFAFAERRGARNWALSDALRERVERNPMVKVDPDAVAYQGLLADPDSRSQIYEPLHGELRSLAALFGTRFVVLPLLLRSTPVAPGAADAADGAPAACEDGGPPHRAELLLALIDIRRSLVLWHGTVRSAPSCPDRGALLAALAATVAERLTES